MTGALLATRRTRTKAENDRDLVDCCERYNRLRALARNATEAQALADFQKCIRVHALEVALAGIDAQWSRHKRVDPFDWRGKVWPRLLTSHPRRLDVSLWVGSVLCGVAAMRLSDSRKWLSITFIEGSPDPQHPLKGLVTPITLVAAGIYASLVQAEKGLAECPTIRILNPLPQSIVAYERVGYSQLIKEARCSYLVLSGERT